MSAVFFFFNDTATTEIYTLSLHDALPISDEPPRQRRDPRRERGAPRADSRRRDRKSTRLNSSHLVISYAVFCLKKKKNIKSYIFNLSRRVNIRDTSGITVILLYFRLLLTR